MKKPQRDHVDDLDLLLSDLCRELGFCNRLTAADLLPTGTALSGEEFAHAVVRAESMNPEYEQTWVQ